jgi:acyl-CoA thioesterase-1
LAYGARAALRNLAVAAILTGSGAAALAETVTVAALGDSLTQGYGLPADQGLVPQLQDWLAARGVDATVLNAGVSGDTTAGGLARADWTLTDDVDALIVALGGNDLLRGLPPDQAKANLAGVLDKAKARGLPVLLVGMRATRNYGGDYKAEFDAIYPDLAKTYGVAFYPYFWAPLAAAIEGGTPQGELFQDDGIHPNAKGVALVVEGIGPAVADLVAKATR